MRKYLLPLFLCISFPSLSQVTVSFSPVVSSGLSVPVDIVDPKDGTGRLFIVQQNGLVKIVSGGVLSPGNFLDVTGIINYDGSERGLLSLAFHPNYSSNRYFFIYYNNTAGDISIAQYRTKASAPDSADPASGKVLMNIPKPFTNHNGGKLNFGPDGNLYFGTGDGGSGGDPNNNSQNGMSLLGKMIRINVDDFTTPPYYTIPPGNPFIGDPAVSDSVYALGLRNPWRWSFDRQTGDMWIADVGQNLWEEVNFRTPANMAGVNYGWRCYEGNHDYNLSLCGTNPSAGKTFPIFEYGHNSSGGFSITGGYVYRGAEFLSLQGYYICVDYSLSNGWLIKPDGAGGWTVLTQNNFPTNITSFGESENGTLYAVKRSGILYKVIASAVTGIDEPVIGREEKIITPNPASATVKVTWRKIRHIRVHDLQGRGLIQMTSDGISNSVDLDISGLYAGMYMISVTSSNGRTITKPFRKY